MEFPQGAVTNFVSIDGFSKLYWRVYLGDVSSLRSSQGKSPGATALKCSVQLKSSALALRKMGCLVFPFTQGFALWIFSVSPNFEVLEPISRLAENGERDLLVVGDAAVFRNAVFGAVSAAQVLEQLATDPESSVLSGNRNDTNDSAYIAAIQSITTFSACYSAFISAVCATVTLNLTLQNKVIPLGRRSFLTKDNAEHQSGYSSPLLFLSALNVDLTPGGKLVISSKPSPQLALEQLPLMNFDDIIDKDELLWLAPNCAVCRFICSEQNSNDKTDVEPASADTATSKAAQKEWKTAVSDWLEKFGLSLENGKGELWIEVEIVSLPDNKIIEALSRRSAQPASLKRILWPARLSFRRRKYIAMDDSHIVDAFFSQEDTPLSFAERWLRDSTSRDKAVQDGETDNSKKQPSSDLGSSTAKADTIDTRESLARVIHYPETQLASAVYPTPPGGVLGHASGLLAPSEGPSTSLTDPTNCQQISTEGVYNSVGATGDTDLTPSGINTTSELGVGSGMYDAAGDDDLFEEMDGIDFGGKGITEDDFDFFDDPDFTGGQKDINMERFGEPVFQDGPELVESTTSTDVPTLDMQPDDTFAPTKGPTAPHTDAKIDSRHVVPLTIEGVRNSKVDSRPSKSDQRLEDIKRHLLSPPLSPVQIRKILFSETRPSHESNSTKPTIRRSRSNRTSTHYDPIAFKQGLGSSDKKYRLEGRFWFDLGKGKPSVSNTGDTYSPDIPTIGFPSSLSDSQHRSNNVNRDLGGVPVAKMSQHEEPQSPTASSDAFSEDGSDPGDVSDISSPSVELAGGKRKRNLADDGSPTTPCENPALMPVTERDSLGPEKAALLAMVLFDHVDSPLPERFPPSGNDDQPLLTWKEDLIQVAQLVVDQVTQSTLRLDHDMCCLRNCDGLEETIPDNLWEQGNFPGQMAKLDLHSYSMIEDTPNHPLPRKDSAVNLRPVTGSIKKLSPPYVRVRRGDGSLEVLAPAIAFWETFGLGPLCKEKDILPFCLYPPNIAEAAEVFLERIGQTYSSCNFGKHSRLTDVSSLVPWALNPSGEQNYASLMRMLKTTCEALGNALTNLPTTGDNVVIYIINPFNHDAALADISSAFLRLFHKYVNDANKQHVKGLNELVLQIVPLSFVAAAETIIVPSQSEYLRLALEVYSRCPPKDESSDYLGSSPPLILSEPIPRTVAFKASQDSVSPLDDGRCLHVAYSQSVDQRWVTACWTDNTGCYQTSLSYCLREKGANVSRPISDIREDIWDATKDIIEMSQSRWRVMLAKDEPIEPEEIEAWKLLVDGYNQGKAHSVELTILSVDTKPCLSYKLPAPQLRLSALSQQLGASGPQSTTPVSTPRPSVPSPESSAPAGTPPTITSIIGTPLTPADQQQQQSQPQQPPLDPDSDTTLIDISDETWAMTLSYKLNNSRTPSIYHPTLASGYLLRRAGTSETEGLASLTVNILYSPPRRQLDTLLDDVLRMYGDLATLARAKGIFHAQGDSVLPWHIATAKKGQEVLYRTSL